MDKLAKWCDEWKLAWMGVVMLTKNKKFLITAGITFLVFGTIMNLLATSGLNVFKVINFSVLFKALGGLFGIGKDFLDWASVFFVAILQGILVGLVGFVWKKRKDDNSANAQSVGIAAGLAILGTGCPTCGTTLLTPIIGMIFSGSSYAIAGAISNAITWVAVIIALLSIKKIGLEVYVIIASRRFHLKQGKDNEQSD